MREFCYVTGGPMCVLVADGWWTLLDDGEVGERLLEDDGSRGWQLSSRLAPKLGLQAVAC